MNENYFEAAVRHWVDGKILEENGEYDNAVCMQGFAAECAMKKILSAGFSDGEVRRYSHQGETLLQDMTMMMTNDNELLSILDPACRLRLSDISLPQILFKEHPERRYYPDGKYGQEEARQCREAVAENGTKVVTFYSFKGGMGRTTALAGVALSLGKQGYDIMMVDTDIEAPGLSTLFFDEDVVQRGVLDFLLEYPLIPEREISEYVLDITDASLLNEEDGRLFLLPAGKVDENYLQKLARIDYQDNREGYLEDILKRLLNKIQAYYHVDYILIDARAGFHDMGGIVVSYIPHGAVLFGNNSRQSWDGITQILRTLAESHVADWPLMLVDAMCESPTSSNYASQKEQFIQKAYTTCVDNFYDNSSPMPGIEAEGVVHSPEFISFNYSLLNGIKLFSSGSQEQDDIVQAYKEILTGSSYRKIADRIKEWFGED